MVRYSSDSDSDNRKKSSKKSKKKSKSKRRSRSSSYDTGRLRDSRRRSRSDSRRRSLSSDRSKRSRSRDERKRRRRSISEDSYRTKRSNRRSKSRTRSPRRRRSRSKDSSRDDGYSRRHRSRSRSHEKLYKKKKKSKKGSRDRSPIKKDSKQISAKAKDPCEDIPGFSEMTPAQQSRLRVQAAFKSAEENSSNIQSAGQASPDQVESAIEQLQKAQVIDDIEDSGFMPTHFTSSRSNKSKETVKLPSWPTNLAEQEDYHEMAIFGNSSALALDEQTKKEIKDATEPAMKRSIRWEKRDAKSLAHPNLHISLEDAERRWIDKLNSMRREIMASRGT